MLNYVNILNIQNLERQNFERQNIEHKNCFRQNLEHKSCFRQNIERQNIEHNIFMPNAIQLRGRWLAIPSTVYMHRSLESGCLTDITYK